MTQNLIPCISYIAERQVGVARPKFKKRAIRQGCQFLGSIHGKSFFLPLAGSRIPYDQPNLDERDKVKASVKNHGGSKRSAQNHGRRSGTATSFHTGGIGEMLIDRVSMRWGVGGKGQWWGRCGGERQPLPTSALKNLDQS